VGEATEHVGERARSQDSLTGGPRSAQSRSPSSLNPAVPPSGTRVALAQSRPGLAHYLARRQRSAIARPPAESSEELSERP